MRIVISVVVITLVFSSIGLWLGVHGDSKAGETNMNYGISMTTDKISYYVGEPVKMTLKIFNYTKKDIVFYFNTSQRYDFIIEYVEGNEIWRWSQDMMFAMVLGEETLGLDSPEIIYTAEYKGELVPGYYKVTGIFVAKDRPMSGNVIIIVK